jgi:hypothetical protein
MNQSEDIEKNRSPSVVQLVRTKMFRTETIVWLPTSVPSLGLHENVLPRSQYL